MPPALYRWMLFVKQSRLDKHPDSDSLSQHLDPLFAEHARLNKDLSASEFALSEHLVFGIHPNSRFSFEYFTYRSADMKMEMDNFLLLTKGKKVLLDVGALHGIFSLSFTRQNPGSTALAVEPSPIAYSTLLYNIHKNPDCRICPYELALSKNDATIQMSYQWEHLVATNEENQNASDALLIQAITGDKLCESVGILPDVVKIDTEGYELECLEGLEHTIKSIQPLLFLEVHPPLTSTPMSKISEFLQNAGYVVFKDDLTRLSWEDLNNLSEVTRITAMTNEAADALVK